MIEYISPAETSLIDETEKEAFSMPMTLLKEKIEQYEKYVKQLSVSSEISYNERLKLTLMKEIYAERNNEEV